jgi:N-acetylglucosamine kinase-like BadF-type ATPase
MQDILRKYLEKQGIEDVTKLTPEEKETFKQWEEAFSHDLRAENVATYLGSQIGQLNKQLREAVKRGEDRAALMITARVENYEALQAMLQEPKRRRDEIEALILSKL